MKKTITECLVELKLLKARIDKETKSSTFVSFAVGKKNPAGYKTKEDFIKEAKASLTSIKTLISNRNKIKAAIVASNAVTSVEIAGEKYTVAEAIERKNSIIFEKELIKCLISQFVANKARVEQSDLQNQAKLDGILLATFGKEGKAQPDQIGPVSENFWKENRAELLDPLNVVEESQKLERDINDFLAAVDVALTISNSTTSIEVEL